MRILGIDYGSKRVGIAIADTETGMAFPKAVLSNDKFLIGEIKKLAIGIQKIIIGESRDFQGNENTIFTKAENFKKFLEKETGLDVIYEPEFFSTYQATRIQGDNDMIDASAATIILQSYMDRHKND